MSKASSISKIVLDIFKNCKFLKYSCFCLLASILYLLFTILLILLHGKVDAKTTFSLSDIERIKIFGNIFYFIFILQAAYIVRFAKKRYLFLVSDIQQYSKVIVSQYLVIVLFSLILIGTLLFYFSIGNYLTNHSFNFLYWFWNSLPLLFSLTYFYTISMFLFCIVDEGLAAIISLILMIFFQYLSINSFDKFTRSLFHVSFAHPFLMCVAVLVCLLFVLTILLGYNFFIIRKRD